MNQVEITRICTILVIIGFILTISIIVSPEVASASDGKGSWTTNIPMPTARAGHGVVSCDGKIYAIGGYKTGSKFLDTVEIYNPNSDSWDFGTPMPIELTDFGITTYGDKIYVMGGYGGKPVSPNTHLLVYDTSTDSWEYKTGMPTPRTCLSAVQSNGKIYAIGGGGGNMDELEIYDILQDSWTTGPPMPTPRRGFSCALVDNKIFAICGDGPGDGCAGVNTVEAFDIDTNTWDTDLTDFPNLNPYANSYAGCGVANGMVYVMGGHDAYYDDQYNTVFQYNPGTNKWSEMTKLPTKRAGFCVTEFNGKLYAIGGKQLNWNCFSSYEIGGNRDIYLTTNEVFTPPSTKDNEKPTVIITSPSNNAELSGTVNIIGTASDSDGTIQNVQIRVDSGSWLTVSGTESWTYGWDTTAVSNGEHTIYARSHDGEDYSDVFSIAITVNNPTSGNNRPTVTITFPGEGDKINGTVTIIGAASDSDGTVQKVEIKIDAGLWIPATGTTSWSYSWSTTNLEDGGHVVNARSYDGVDYSQTEMIIVSVQNDQETGDGTPGFGLIIGLSTIALVFLWKRYKAK